MAKIEIKLIGQTEAKSEINDMLNARAARMEAGENFRFRPYKFSGLTGLGKTELAERIASAMEEEGFRFHQIPANAGWNYWAELAKEVASIDEETGMATAIPAVIFIDEAHAQKTLNDVFKIVFGKDHAHLYERNGKRFFYDPSQHLVIFASNHKLDAAIERRCQEIKLQPFTTAEKKQLIRLFANKAGREITSEAVDYLESRVKPTAGEVQNMMYSVAELCISKEVSIEEAKKRSRTHFPQGLDKTDIALLQRIAQGNATVATLKFIAQDDKKKDTQARVDWLIALGFVEASKHGFGITQKGMKYFEAIAEEQKEQKAKKAAPKVKAKATTEKADIVTK